MKNILVLSLVILTTLQAHAAYRREIPAPVINSITTLIAQGDTLSIKGTGFINNYPQGHIIYLRNERKIKLEPFYSNASELKAYIPTNLSYGDYLIGVKLRTKWLESRINSSTEKTKIRPIAPTVNLSNDYVYKNLDELNLPEQDSDGHQLIYQLLNPLSVGANKLSAHYYEDGYLSMPSTELSIMLLPEAAINPELELDGSKIMVRRKLSPSSLELSLPNQIINHEPDTGTKVLLSLSAAPILIDVSNYSHSNNSDFSQEIYLNSPTKPHYLSKKAFKSPIKIQQIHVKSPESVLLYNQSSKIFPLASCGLSDNIMTRHNFFEPSSITAGDPFLYTGDLGLNDTGGDSLSLDCPCSHPILIQASATAKEQGFTMPDCVSNKMRLDSFSYESLDAGGYGIK